MYTRKLKREIRCPIEHGLDLLGGKWRSRIICVLAAKGILRYSELRTEMANISDTVLAATLKELIVNGMVQRRQYDEIPPKVEYTLTDRGKSAVPLLQAIAMWANGYTKTDQALPSLCVSCDYSDAMNVV